MSQIIDGKAIALQVKQEVKDEIKNNKFNIGLAVVLVGHDAGSQVYVRNKINACNDLGIKSYSYYFEDDVTQDKLLSLIDKLNNDEKVNGILVQLPLPKHINSQLVINSINPYKDVDGFHPLNAGALFCGTKGLKPCTPAGIIRLIESTGVNISGKNAVVVGRSNIVGKPISMLLLSKNATVTITHSKTNNLKEVCKQADILVVAIGKPRFITNEYVKEGAIVIDVGMNRVEKLCGDVDFDSVAPKASYITPVPGGVGPMTIAMLMSNTLEAYKLQNE